MRRIKDRATRSMEERERLAVVARALLEAEPAEASRIDVSVLVWDDDRPPRYPAVGLHPGAIDGTTPHRNPRLDRWPRA